jgi:hypothetical protein
MITQILHDPLRNHPLAPQYHDGIVGETHVPHSHVSEV